MDKGDRRYFINSDRYKLNEIVVGGSKATGWEIWGKGNGCLDEGDGNGNKEVLGLVEKGAISDI